MTDLPDTVPYCHIDAFADRPFTGNQAAVMPLAAWPEDEVLQAIGEENNFAETAFIVPIDSDEAEYELRWFTPAVEIAMCGHATLASGHYVFEQGFAGDTVRFLTRKAGVLSVSRDGEMLSLSLPALPPEPGSLPDWTSLLGGLPSEYHVHPGRYNVLLFDHADDVLTLSPDFKALAALGDHQFICTAPGKDTDVLSRVFVPARRRRGQRDRLGARGADPVLGRATRAQQLHRVPGEPARRAAPLHARRRPRCAGGRVLHGGDGDVRLR